MLGILSAGTAEMETEDPEDRPEMNVLQYGLISLEVVPLENLISSTSSTSSKKSSSLC